MFFLNISPNNFNAFLSRFTSLPRAAVPDKTIGSTYAGIIESDLRQKTPAEIYEISNSPFSSCQASFIKE
jgi:hypothetical protein